jgi:hypothetical protein
MPYSIKHGTGDRPWKIIRKDDGIQVGSSTTKAMAQKAVRARLWGEHSRESMPDDFMPDYILTEDQLPVKTPAIYGAASDLESQSISLDFELTKNLGIPVFFIIADNSGKDVCIAKVYIGKPTKKDKKFIYCIMVIERYDPPKEIKIHGYKDGWVANYDWVSDPPKELKQSSVYDITPETLRQMTEEELLDLNDELHDLYNTANKEDVTNAYIFLRDECDRRGLDLPIEDDEIEKQAKVISQSSSSPEIVPMVVTHQGLSLSGSNVYGTKQPKDYDWIIRHPASERLPNLEQSLQEAFPSDKHHFVYELKGPSWRHIPIGNFKLIPNSIKESFDPSTTVPLMNDKIPKMIPIKDYLFLSEKDGKPTLRINSDMQDNGLQLKLIRIFQDSHLNVIFSQGDIKEGEKLVGSLVVEVYPNLEMREVGEEEFL